MRAISCMMWKIHHPIFRAAKSCSFSFRLAVCRRNKTLVDVRVDLGNAFQDPTSDGNKIDPHPSSQFGSTTTPLIIISVNYQHLFLQSYSHTLTAMPLFDFRCNTPSRPSATGNIDETMRMHYSQSSTSLRPMPWLPRNASEDSSSELVIGNRSPPLLARNRSIRSPLSDITNSPSM
jgi:hypothetical protein